jgi:hypothetical protein
MRADVEESRPCTHAGQGRRGRGYMESPARMRSPKGRSACACAWMRGRACVRACACVRVCGAERAEPPCREGPGAFERSPLCGRWHWAEGVSGCTERSDTHRAAQRNKRNMRALAVARKGQVPMPMWWDGGEPPSPRANADSSPGADAAGQSPVLVPMTHRSTPERNVSSPALVRRKTVTDLWEIRRTDDWIKGRAENAEGTQAWRCERMGRRSIARAYGGCVCVCVCVCVCAICARLSVCACVCLCVHVRVRVTQESPAP